MSETTMKMKLLVDKKKHKVLFAEARKDCVDFLFHILSLPLGTVVGYLTKESISGSLGNLYGSMEDLHTDYLQDGLNRDCLLNPKPPTGAVSQVPLLTHTPAPDLDSGAKTFYACNSIYAAGTTAHRYVSDTAGVNCPSCQRQMAVQLAYAAPATAQTKAPIPAGYVKGVVTYMILDDLCVQPMSMVSSIALLNKFNIQDVSGLEEREVALDMDQGLALLKASLMSKTVLTDAFLVNKLDIN